MEGRRLAHPSAVAEQDILAGQTIHLAAANPALSTNNRKSASK